MDELKHYEDQYAPILADLQAEGFKAKMMCMGGNTYAITFEGSSLSIGCKRNGPLPWDRFEVETYHVSHPLDFRKADLFVSADNPDALLQAVRELL